jgi:hypothetical protein
MMLSASNEDSNGGNDGTTHHTGGANDFVRNSDLGDYVDAIIGPAPSGLTEGGYKKRGSIAVSKIDAAGFYYLNVEGEQGHALKTILQVRQLKVQPKVQPHRHRKESFVFSEVGWEGREGERERERERKAQDLRQVCGCCG